MPEMAALQSWLDAYVEAWRTNDPKKIGALFSQDAVYAWHPYNDTPARGRDAIVTAWLEKPKPAREYKNLFVIRFDVDGRSREFTEWYAEPPATTDA
jgi:ketosteroid isomerase-like protein